MIAELRHGENKKTISHTANGDIDGMQRGRTHKSGSQFIAGQSKTAITSLRLAS